MNPTVVSQRLHRVALLLATGTAAAAATATTMANAFAHLLAGFPSMQRRVASASVSASAGVAAFPFVATKELVAQMVAWPAGATLEPEIDVRCL